MLMIFAVLYLPATRLEAGPNLYDGLLAYFPMNEGSGAEVTDIISNSKAMFQSHEVGKTAPLWQNGAPMLIYADGDHFRIGDPSIGEGVDQTITITARIRLSSASNSLQAIVCKGQSKMVYAFFVDRRGVEGYRLRLFSGHWDPPEAVGELAALGTQVLDLNTWYDVAVTYDGTHVRFYVDGVPDTPIHSPGVTFGTMPDESLFIGAAPPPAAVEYFDGQIRRVGVYDRALSAEEIESVAASGLFPSIDARYAGLWIGEVDLNEVQEVATGEWQPAPKPMYQRRILHFESEGTPHLLAEATLMKTRVTAPDEPQTVVISDPSRIGDFDGIVLRGGHLIGQRFSSTTSPMDTPAQLLAVQSGAGETPHVLTTTLSLPDDHPLNPFRHKYHPDLGRGIAVERAVTITLPTADSPADNTLTGTYSETVTGLHHGTLRTRGTITLNRVSQSGVLNP